MRREPPPLTCSLCIQVNKQDFQYFNQLTWFVGEWKHCWRFMLDKNNPTQSKSNDPSTLRILSPYNTHLAAFALAVLIHNGRCLEMSPTPLERQKKSLYEQLLLQNTHLWLQHDAPTQPMCLCSRKGFISIKRIFISIKRIFLPKTRPGNP